MDTNHTYKYTIWRKLKRTYVYMSKHTEEKKHYMYNCTDRDMKKNVNTVLILKV